MKKVLVTGAGGTIGIQVIRFLLSEGKYEVTAFDLKDRHVYNRLKRYRKRINIVYGDVCDETIIDALVKSHDVVIHLAGALPPFANVREELCREVDYGGTKTIVDSIKNYHPECFLFYASSTSVYGNHQDYESLSLKRACVIDEFDFYSKTKLECEQYIKNNIKNYSIYRLAYVLGDPKSESLIYNVNRKSHIETISSEDAGYAFVCGIDFIDKINKKTYNVSGGEKFRLEFEDYLTQIFRTYGLSIRFLSTYFGAEKNYYGGYYTDGNKLDDLLHFRSKNLDVYYETLNKYKYRITRFLPRVLALPFVLVYRRKK